MSAAALQELAAARGLSRLAQLLGRGDVAALVATAAEAEVLVSRRVGLERARGGLHGFFLSSHLTVGKN
jgi:hypothetical protein